MITGMRRALLALVLLVAGCSSIGKPAHSSSATPAFLTDQQRDAAFVATLAGSSHASEYARRTQQDLIRYAHDLCQQLTAPPGNGVVDIIGMTSDPAAQRFFGNLAAGTYCPMAAGGVAGLLGP
jgi:hypothetical protein